VLATNGSAVSGNGSLSITAGTFAISPPLTLGTPPTASTMLGFTLYDTISYITTIPAYSAINLFSSYVSLPAGVWLITYSLRIESGVAMTIQSYNTYGLDNFGAIAYGQFTNTYDSPQTAIGSSGSFVINSSGSSTYNIALFFGYTTGTPTFNLAGFFSSYVQRTRIG
jgi:hypothetical protein